jgi:uncharacterized membrane protein
MKQALAFTTRAVFSGLLILVPLYLAVLLLLKGMKTVAGLVRPFALLLPDWIPAETALSLVLVLVICFMIGAAVLTRAGQAARNRIERTFFERIPGYALLRGLTQQMAGKSRENIWRPALLDSDDGLLLAFIIEEFADGRYTVFVPSRLRLPAPFTWSTEAGFIPWTCRSLTPSRLSPDGVRERRIWSRRWSERKGFAP